MPNLTTTRAITGALSESTDEIYIYLITIRYITFGTTTEKSLKYVNVRTDIGDYVAKHFEFTIPSSNPDRPPLARLTIEDHDIAITAALRDVEKAPLLDVVLALEDSPEVPEGELKDLLIRNLSGGEDGTLSFDLVWDNLVDEPYPTHRYGPALFPGLFK